MAGIALAIALRVEILKFIDTESKMTSEFKARYKTHFSMTRAFFTRRGVSEEEALELTQDVFLRVYQKQEQFRGDASFRTWLHEITVNVWKNYVRANHTRKREGTLVPFDEKIGSGWSEDPLDDFIHEEEVKRLYDAVRALPEGMRKCLTLRVHHGLKYREIAGILKISVETVKSQLGTAQKRLKADLNDVKGS